MADYGRPLAQAGLKVRNAYGKARHRPGAFGPLAGIIVHITVGAKTGDAPSLRVIQDGRSDVPGPLSQLLLGRSGLYYVTADGRANHAGKGSGRALTAVRAHDGGGRPGPDDTDGNRYFIGIEVENAAGGQAFPPAQYEALVLGLAALCRAHGWTAGHVIGHKEWTRRKVDPPLNMDTLRADVTRALAPPKPATKVVRAVQVKFGATVVGNYLKDDYALNKAREGLLAGKVVTMTVVRRTVPA